MTVHGYHHIGLFTADAKRSLKFYTEGLGGKEVHHFTKSGTDMTIYLVDLGGNAVVEIVPRGTGEPEANARWAHIALAVDDVWEACEQAVAAGAKMQDEPARKMLGTMCVSNAFVIGPDGEKIEFFHVESSEKE